MAGAISTTMPPRFLLPRPLGTHSFSSLSRGTYTLASTRLQRPCFLGRQASSKSNPSSSKPRVLEKPAKFNPPSHPARLNKSPRSFPGPPFSAKDREAQKTKRYPHMMPAEGTFMHWLLTNRSIHIYITLGTLFCLASFTFIENFNRTSPFAHLLPPSGDVLCHPLASASMYIEILKMHTAHVSAETAEQRKRKVEDVEKRKQYRRAHGLEAKPDLDNGDAESHDGLLARVQGSTDAAVDPSPSAGGVNNSNAEVYADWEGRKKPVKKWLGIW